jgi:hypothetical protein
VDVHVVIPKEKNTVFHGNLSVQNKNNASDVVTIPVTLTTTASSFIVNANPLVIMFLHWLSLKLFSRHDMSQPLSVIFVKIQDSLNT